jgi:predicted SAM-dependent methyltransferase
MFNLRAMEKLKHRLVYIGCGHDRLPGFIHVEINLGKNKAGLPDVLADISEWIPLPNSSVDLVYSVATLEHLTYTQLLNCLLESRRILKRGGVVRLVVPNLDKYVQDYLHQVYDPGEKATPDYPNDNYVDTFVFRTIYFDHRYLHNFDTMRRALEKAGFDQARVCVPGDSQIVVANPQLAKTETGRVDDIIIEAVKLDRLPTARMTPANYPRNILLWWVARVFNLRLTAFKHREAHFPQRYWWVGVGMKVRQRLWWLERRWRPWFKFLYEK